MDIDVGDETIFSAIFPLPFRVLALAGLGILAWATNLHGLKLLGIDAATALDLNTHRNRDGRTQLPITNRPGWKHVEPPDAIYKPVYNLFALYSLITGIFWLIYWRASSQDLSLVDVFKYIPGIAGLCVFMLLVSPWNTFGRHERDQFLKSISRCLFASSSHPVAFSDVLFADVFTSYAKVVGDVWLSLCMLLPGGSLLLPPAQTGLSRWILPTFMSLPYAVRFRQCLIDYLHPSNNSRRPLYNALKYASSFPVIYLSAAQRLVEYPSSSSGNFDGAHGSHGSFLFQLWLLAAAINSLYSFWWDVTHDWGFDLLLPRAYSGQQPRYPPKRLVLPGLHSSRSESIASSPRDTPTKERYADEETSSYFRSNYTHARYPYGLRPTLLFSLPIYPFVIVADLVLRLTWSVKLSSHLHSYSEGDFMIFCFEFAELLRRWMWLFIRVEWEIVKGPQHPSAWNRDHLEDPHISGNGAAGVRMRDSGSVDEEEYEMITSDRSGKVSDVG